MSYDRVALIGIGNILFYDEGLGAYLVKYIEENYEIPLNLKVLEGSTLGFTLMTYYQEYDKIIVVGNGSQEGEPGTIISESSEEILSGSNIRKTANEVEIRMMVEICSFHEKMGEVQLITMVPKDIIQVRNGLTSEIFSCMPKLLDATLQELEKSGIYLEAKAREPRSLESIIEEYANPRQTFDCSV